MRPLVREVLVGLALVVSWAASCITAERERVAAKAGR